MWIPSENTYPVLYHAPTRKSVAVFGAVCPADGRLVELPPKKWTGGEGALRPTFFSEEVWYNARHETSA